MSFVIVPVLSIVLLLQGGAKGRLVEVGITPHPAIEETIGVAAGIGSTPLWVFRVNTTAESVAEFYRTEANREGWKLLSDSRDALILGRDHNRMSIGVYQAPRSRTLTYLLTKEPGIQALPGE